MRPSEKAWMGIAAGVIAYDVLCPDGETLSEGVDRALEHHTNRFMAIGAIALTSAHLLNIIPERIDPFHHALKWKIRDRLNEY